MFPLWFLPRDPNQSGYGNFLVPWAYKTDSKNNEAMGATMASSMNHTGTRNIWVVGCFQSQWMNVSWLLSILNIFKGVKKSWSNGTDSVTFNASWKCLTDWMFPVLYCRIIWVPWECALEWRSWGALVGTFWHSMPDHAERKLWSNDCKSVALWSSINHPVTGNIWFPWMIVWWVVKAFIWSTQLGY